MPVTDKEKRFWAYFLNDKGQMQYFEQCLRCIHGCKQSFRITELRCRKYGEKE